MQQDFFQGTGKQFSTVLGDSLRGFRHARTAQAQVLSALHIGCICQLQVWKQTIQSSVSDVLQSYHK